MVSRKLVSNLLLLNWIILSSGGRSLHLTHHRELVSSLSESYIYLSNNLSNRVTWTKSPSLQYWENLIKKTLHWSIDSGWKDIKLKPSGVCSPFLIIHAANRQKYYIISHYDGSHVLSQLSVIVNTYNTIVIVGIIIIIVIYLMNWWVKGFEIWQIDTTWCTCLIFHGEQKGLKDP